MSNKASNVNPPNLQTPQSPHKQAPEDPLALWLSKYKNTWCKLPISLRIILALTVIAAYLYACLLFLTLLVGYVNFSKLLPF